MQRSKYINHSAITELAASNTSNAHELARTFQVNRGTVRNMQTYAVGVYHNLQQKAFAQLADALFDKGRFPDVAVMSLAWDETQEALVLPFNNTNGMRYSARTSWHVLVSRQNYIFQIGDDCVQLEPVRPVVPLISTGAGAIFAGLEEVPTVDHLAKFDERVMTCCPRVALHYDSDGATANDRVVAVRCRQVPPHVLVSHMTCGNHRNQLTEAAVHHTLGMDLLSGLYSLVLWLRMSSNWLRLLSALPRLVAQKCCCVPRPHKKIADAPLSAEVADYLRVNRMHGEIRDAVRVVASSALGPEESDDDANEKMAAQRSRWSKAMDDLLDKHMETYPTRQTMEVD